MAVTENEKPRFTADQFFALISEEDVRAELLNGEIVMQAGASTRHQRISNELSFALTSYVKKNGGKCSVFYAPYDVVLNDRNVVQPDVMVICDPTKLGEKKAYGAPDLVIEILSEDKKRDLVTKHGIYAEGGVREYWIVDPFKDRVIVYYFGSIVDVSFYDFDKPVPVGIWDGELEINLAELLGDN